jgi:aminoglycoside phosphotransferase (APT) family kinase protein
VPWQKVGTIAAAIHRIGPAVLPGLQPRYPTRRDHAEAAIEELGEMTEPEGREAHAWAKEHIPPAAPSTLVHGDLLGQNILVGMDGRDAVIDWEYAQFGDPAYDLAIVTRGVRRPFQVEGGMERLLDAYANAGGADVTRAHVQVHELAMVARWYQDALEGRSRHAPQHYLQLLRGMLGRVRT